MTDIMKEICLRLTQAGMMVKKNEALGMTRLEAERAATREIRLMSMGVISPNNRPGEQLLRLFAGSDRKDVSYRN